MQKLIEDDSDSDGGNKKVALLAATMKKNKEFPNAEFPRGNKSKRRSMSPEKRMKSFKNETQAKIKAQLHKEEIDKGKPLCVLRQSDIKLVSTPEMADIIAARMLYDTRDIQRHSFFGC